MRIVPIIALCSVVILSGCSDDEVTTTDISPQQVLQLISARAGDPGFVILDVRTPSEFEEDRIDGAINIDLQSESFWDEIAFLDTSKTYLVYCRSGRRSAIAVEGMVDRGFRDVHNLVGGLVALREYGASLQ